jgi:hypothetical protein
MAMPPATALPRPVAPRRGSRQIARTRIRAGVCTLSGSTVAYDGSGTCTIDANQAGNSTYAAAPQARLTITVSDDE